MLKFPKNKIEWALFKGVEQEGPLRGRDTLFMVSDVPVERILSNCLGYREIALYFGAGRSLDYNPNTVLKVLDSIRLDPYKNISAITIESPIVDWDLLSRLCLCNSSCDFPLRVHWFVPIVWEGRELMYNINTYPQSYLSKLALEYQRCPLAIARYSVYLKVDLAQQVVITRYDQAMVNSTTAGYVQDKLIFQKERK